MTGAVGESTRKSSASPDSTASCALVKVSNSPSCCRANTDLVVRQRRRFWLLSSWQSFSLIHHRIIYVVPYTSSTDLNFCSQDIVYLYKSLSGMQLPSKSFHFADTSWICLFKIRYVYMHMPSITLIWNIKEHEISKGWPYSWPLHLLTKGRPGAVLWFSGGKPQDLSRH